MKRTQQKFAISVVIALSVFSVVPLQASQARLQPSASYHAGVKSKIPVFAFGRTGGNIVPVKVSILSTGLVTVSGPVRAQQPGLRLSSDVIKGLLKLTSAEKFFSLPKHLSGGLFPDSASLFITVSTRARTRTVYLHVTHNARFEQLLAVLMEATHVSF
jgi:hypothetical protein